MLRAVTEAWWAELRPADTLARYGGEEFLALLPTCDASRAARSADRLRAAVPSGLTASAGVAQWDGTETVAALIERADAALYEAKRSGRNATVQAAARPVAGCRARSGPRTAKRAVGIRAAGA